MEQSSYFEDVFEEGTIYVSIEDDSPKSIEYSNDQYDEDSYEMFH